MNLPWLTDAQCYVILRKYDIINEKGSFAMFIKIIISAIISFGIFLLFDYISFRKRKKILMKINKNILSAVAKNYSAENIAEIVKDSLNTEKLNTFVSNMFITRKYNTVEVRYDFNIADNFENIKFEIRRNVLN